MKLLSLSCQHCGAPLEVPVKVKQLTCSYCNSRLVVRRTGSAVYSEVLGDVAESVARIEDDTRYIRLQNELERVDREWTRKRERYMVRRQDGTLRVPSKGGSAGAGVAVAVFGVVWTIIAGTIGGPVFAVFGVAFVVLAISGSLASRRKAEDFERAQRKHRRERRRILAEMKGG